MSQCKIEVLTALGRLFEGKGDSKEHWLLKHFWVFVADASRTEIIQIIQTLTAV